MEGARLPHGRHQSRAGRPTTCRRPPAASFPPGRDRAGGRKERRTTARGPSDPPTAAGCGTRADRTPTPGRSGTRGTGSSIGGSGNSHTEGRSGEGCDPNNTAGDRTTGGRTSHKGDPSSYGTGRQASHAGEPGTGSPTAGGWTSQAGDPSSYATAGGRTSQAGDPSAGPRPGGETDQTIGRCPRTPSHVGGHAPGDQEAPRMTQANRRRGTGDRRHPRRRVIASPSRHRRSA